MPTQQLTVTVPVKAGTHAVGVAFVSRAWEPEDVVQPPRTGWGFGTDEMYDANPAVESVTIEGPFKPTGVSDTPSRQRIFTLPSEGGVGATRSVRAHNPVRARPPRVPPAGRRRRRRDADRLLPHRPRHGDPQWVHTATLNGSARRPSMGRLTASRPGSRRRSSGCSSAPTSCSGSSRIPRAQRRARRIA